MDLRNKLTLHRVPSRRVPRTTLSEFFLKFGLVLFIAFIFTAADAFSADVTPEPLRVSQDL
jgi:hypothetical protein